MALTVGSEISVATSTAPSVIVPLSSSKALAVYGDFGSNLMKAIVLNVSGLTVTKGSAATIDSDETNPLTNRCDLAPNGSGGGVFAYIIDVGATFDAQLVWLPVSGSTVGTPSILVLDTNVSTSHLSIDQLTTDKYICLYGLAFPTAEVKAFVVTQSGTTLTDQTPLQLETAVINAAHQVVALSSTRAIAVYPVGTSIRASLLNISGNTVTEVDEVDFEANANPTGQQKKFAARINSTQAAVAYRVGSTAKMVILEDGTSTLNIGSVFTGSFDEPHQVAPGVNTSSFMMASASFDSEVETHTVSGTTISAGGDNVSMPNSPTFALIAQLSSNKWIGLSRVGVGPDVEAFAFSTSPTGLSYDLRHSAGGIPGAIL